jgi:hypothetical protein
MFLLLDPLKINISGYFYYYHLILLSLLIVEVLMMRIAMWLVVGIISGCWVWSTRFDYPPPPLHCPSLSVAAFLSYSLITAK